MKSPATRKYSPSIISVFVLLALIALIAACGTTGNTTANAGTKNSTQPKGHVTATTQPNGKGHVTPIATTQPSNQPTRNGSTSQPNSTTPIAGPQEGSTNACSGTSGLSTIRMLNTTQGWASNQTAVFTTSDGGHTWKCVTPAGMQTQTGVIGDFMDASHAWITADLLAGGNTISIWRTSDGGQSWQSSTISANEPQVGDAPHFVNTQDGWLEVINGGPGAGSESAEIFQTTDGGQTWNVVANTNNSASGLPAEGLKTGISFKDTLNGWATGTDASNTPWLYVTHDGGKTWQKQTLPDLPGAIGTAATAISYQTTPPVFFGNTGLLPVFITGQLAQNQPVNGFLLYHTTNGGQSWYTDWKSNPATLTSFATNQNELYIADPLHAWAGVANSNAIYATSDGGESWQELGTHFGPASDISFVNPSDGWAFLSNVGPVSTIDGGVNWKILMYNYA